MGLLITDNLAVVSVIDGLRAIESADDDGEREDRSIGSRRVRGGWQITLYAPSAPVFRLMTGGEEVWRRNTACEQGGRGGIIQ